MLHPTFSPESTSAWEIRTARLNTWRDPTKSTPTGSSIFTSIQAWTPCGMTHVSRTCCSESASRTSDRRPHQENQLRELRRWLPNAGSRSSNWLSVNQCAARGVAAIACDFYFVGACVLAELAAIFVVGAGLTLAWWVRAFVLVA